MHATSECSANGPLFADPFRQSIRAHIDRIAAEEGIEVEYIKKPKEFRKEDRIREIVARRGDHPGLVHIFSVMELCSSYRPWHDKRTGMTYLRGDSGKCVYYYFYFIDEVLGLCFLSVPTWCLFRAQFYFNGHNWLASKLRAAGIAFALQDNAFAEINDWQKAQELSDEMKVTEIHARMDAAVARYVPDLAPLGRYHWSISQMPNTPPTSSSAAETIWPRSTIICSARPSTRSSSRTSPRIFSSFPSSQAPLSLTDAEILAFLQSIVRRTDYPYGLTLV